MGRLFITNHSVIHIRICVISKCQHYGTVAEISLTEKSLQDILSMHAYTDLFKPA